MSVQSSGGDEQAGASLEIPSSQTPITGRLRRIIVAIGECWRLIADVYSLFEPARVSFLLLGIAFLVFFKVDQGVEILRSLAEGDLRDGGLRWAQQTFFFGALFYWSWQSWYWPRTMLRFRFPSTPAQERLEQWPFPFLMQELPRVLGVLPAFVVGWACWKASMAYGQGAGQGPQTHLREMAFASWVGGILLYIFFYARRKWLNRSGDDNSSNEAAITSRKDLPSSTKAVLVASIALVILQVLVFVLWPVGSATVLGSGSILLLAAAAWVSFVSFLVYAGDHYRFPVISALLVVVALSSFFNDNHPIRALRRISAEKAKKASVGEEFSRWLTIMDKSQSGGVASAIPYPLFIVTTEGGGIRAAYWTATVLGTLQEADPTFSSHLFAISGVSGGSVGSAVFGALLAENPADGKYVARMQHMMGRDYLSPPLAAMLHGDFLQRFIPFPFDRLDRGRALEKAWEAGWREEIYNDKVVAGTKVFARDRFGEDMMNLWQEAPADRWMPALFLNGTCVELGDRVIASNLYVAAPYDGGFTYGGEFIDAQDADSEQAYLPMRLSTAAHLSARFTYVSPAGRLKSGRRVVDGGYFENSGAATAWDILRVIERHPDRKRVRPIVITISNDPSSDQYGVIEPLANKTTQASSEAVTRNFLSETLSPVDTLLSTREGRGRYAQVQIKREMLMLTPDGDNKSGDRPSNYFYFGLKARDVPLPLGWMLSRGAAQEMSQQIQVDIPPLSNRTEAIRLLNVLHSK
jgi:hypothetical protein